MDASRVFLLTLAAILFTWLNAVKPYVIDDYAYHYYAVEFATPTDSLWVPVSPQEHPRQLSVGSACFALLVCA